MLDYRTPGVYVEWLEPPPGVGIARTDIAGFIGIAERGPLHRPVKVTSFSQFQALFGRYIAQGFLAYAVQGFFLNRGSECWVVRVDDPLHASAAGIEVFGPDGRALLRLQASSPGSWGNAVRVRVLRRSVVRVDKSDESSPGNSPRFHSVATFDFLIKLADGTEQRINDPLKDLIETPVPFSAGEPQLTDIEISLPVVVKPSNDRSARYAAMAGRISVLDAAEQLMIGGADGLATLRVEHFTGENRPNPRQDDPWGLVSLNTIRDVALVAIPDLMPKEAPPKDQPSRPTRCLSLEAPVEPLPPAPAPVQTSVFDTNKILEAQYALMVQCEKLQDRFAILDMPALRDTVAIETWRHQNLQQTSYAAVYAPWILVDDPLQLSGPVRAIPPSGHVAGLMARVDRFRGVHKPPANEILEGTRSVMVSIDEAAHGDLNTAGINAIRALQGRGIRVVGERTLFDEPILRYVNVRRLLIMIRRAIESDTQWIPFEPNNLPLRLDIDRVIRGFLQGLFERGMLDGATPDEAFSVKCDETNNDDVSTAQGKLICEIGVQPPWPAEFVRVVIGKTQSGIETIEERGTPDA